MSRPDDRAVKSASVARGTQTILTSRGFLSLAGQSRQDEPPDEPSAPSRARADRPAENKSVCVQVTPTHPASILRSEESRSSTLPREIITLTTDYEDRSEADGLSSSVHLTNVESGTAGSAGSPRRRHSPPPTILFERRRRRGRWGLPCCSSVDDYYEYEIRSSGARGRHSAPPSYSALYPRQVRPELPGLFDGSSSFTARTPPPSYAQAQGICVAFSLEQLVSNSAGDGRILSPRSTTAVCPRCATLVITVVEVHRATATHVTAFALFLMGCWPCCMLPYCLDSCKTSDHYCPYCRSYLGTYNPW